MEWIDIHKLIMTYKYYSYCTLFHHGGKKFLPNGMHQCPQPVASNTGLL